MIKFYIKVWPNHTATLMTGQGHRLWTFDSADEAVIACEDWYRMEADLIGIDEPAPCELRYAG